MALSQEAVQSMLDAMKIISSAEMNNISYDTTIVCTITDTSHAAKESYYMVTDGSVKFKAYVLSTEDTTKYKVDDQVYVKVPCGDFTRQKVIEGYYVADSAEIPATYVSPLQGFLNMTSLSDDVENGRFTDVDKALIANKSDKIALWQWSITPSSANADDLQMNGLYDTLIVQADFQSLMSNRRMYSGTYGLQLDLYVRLHPTSELHTVKTVKLDSSEMFGNPYAFSLYSTQAKSFDISSIGIVDGMTLYFYQNNDFNYYNDKGVVTRLPQAINPNLLAKNVYVAMGSDITRIADNSIKLYTLEDQAFKYSEASDSTNKKNIGFVWYNKDEDNNYIGFSDGVIYPEKNPEDENDIFPYDELAYIDLTTANSRLVAQQGKAVPTDRNGLTVSANVTDAETTIKTITTLLQVELRNTLNALSQRVSGLSKITDTLTADEYFRGATDPVYTGKIKDVQNYADTFIKETNKMITWYKDALAAACAIQTHQTQETTPETPVTFTVDETVNYSPWTYYRKTFKPSFYNNGFILEELKIAIEERYNGFQSQYDTYSIKLNKIFADLDVAFKQLEDLLDGQNIKITSTSDKEAEDKYQYHINREIIPFESEDFSKYNNRYCVYWYRYDEHYTGDPILEAGWKRLETEAAIQTNSDGTVNAMPQNLGLPSEYSNVNTDEHPIYHLAARPKPEESFLTVYLNPEKKEEKFKVVIFYNHEKFVSDELVFTNGDELVDTTTLDVNGSIKISHGTQSKDSYQTFYNSNNTLINQADSSVGRQLSVSYDGAFGDNNSLAEAQIFWYVPKNSTMLDVNLTKLTNKNSYNFVTDYYRTVEVISEEDVEIYAGPALTYNKVVFKKQNEDGTITEISKYSKGDVITQVYDKRGDFYSLTPNCDIGDSLGLWINAKQVKVIDNDETYMDGYACFYKTIGFTEEDAEEGEEKIKVVKSDDLTFEYKIKNYYVSTALNNTIFCIVKKLEYVFETSILMTFGTQGTCGTDYTLLVQPSTMQRGVTNSTPLPLSLQLFNYNNEEVPINGANSNASNLRVKWFGPSTYLSSIEIKVDDDGNETGDTNAEVNSLTMSLNTLDDKVAAARCGIAQVEVTINDEKYGGVADLSVKYPVAYSAGDYYIEGPTTVIYDSTGGNPLYYKEKYKLFQASTNQPIDEVIWNLQYYMFETPTNIVDSNSRPPQYMFERDPNDFTKFIITKFGDGETAQGVSDEVKFYHGYMPQLDTENKLIPSAIYIGEVHDDHNNKFYLNAYPVVCAYEKLTDDYGNVSKGTLLWAQPIVIDQNRYPNSVANAWDGKFKIDEKNGTIMSSMVGAGYKNTDNTYSGVLMGNISGSQDVIDAGNKTDVGVYGFHHGAQSFGLNIDGTAFFGKSGRGRILIDGNSGTISSASYQQNKIPNGDGTYRSDAGMMIDLDDGFIDMRGVSKNGSDYTPDKTEEVDGDIVKTAQSHVRIDVCSPYFTIRSANQFDPNKHIIHIADDEYYLQSDNYIQGTYSLAEGIELCPEGYLSRKSNHQIDGIDIKDLSGNQVYRYSYVDKNGNQLIDADGNEIYLIPAHSYDLGEGAISADEVRNGDFTKRVYGKGQGTKFDLQNGSLDAYNLLITSKNVYLDSRENADPFFVIRDNDGCNLIYAGKDNYYLKSHNYSVENKTGFKLDLFNSSIDSYDFRLQANSSGFPYEGSYILINSGKTTNTSPQLIVHYVDNEWRVDAEGNEYLAPIHVSNLLEVHDNIFSLKSADWWEDDVLPEIEQTIPVKVQYVIGLLNGASLNIRTGPVVDDSTYTGEVQSNSTTARIYNAHLTYSEDEAPDWWSVSSQSPQWLSITPPRYNAHGLLNKNNYYIEWNGEDKKYYYSIITKEIYGQLCAVIKSPLIAMDKEIKDKYANIVDKYILIDITTQEIIIDSQGEPYYYASYINDSSIEVEDTNIDIMYMDAINGAFVSDESAFPILFETHPDFIIGTDPVSGREGRWVSRYYNDDNKWTYDLETLADEEVNIVATVTAQYQGTCFDVTNGKLSMFTEIAFGEGGRMIEIDSQQYKTPFFIGESVEGRRGRGVSIDWDGSLAGGSTYPWSIAANGQAKFNGLKATGGTLTNFTVLGTFYYGTNECRPSKVGFEIIDPGQTALATGVTISSRSWRYIRVKNGKLEGSANRSSWTAIDEDSGMDLGTLDVDTITLADLPRHDLEGYFMGHSYVWTPQNQSSGGGGSAPPVITKPNPQFSYAAMG